MIESFFVYVAFAVQTYSADLPLTSGYYPAEQLHYPAVFLAKSCLCRSSHSPQKKGLQDYLPEPDKECMSY
jgi:hypothetical protein